MGGTESRENDNHQQQESSSSLVSAPESSPSHSAAHNPLSPHSAHHRLQQQEQQQQQQDSQQELERKASSSLSPEAARRGLQTVSVVQGAAALKHRAGIESKPKEQQPQNNSSGANDDDATMMDAEEQEWRNAQQHAATESTTTATNSNNSNFGQDASTSPSGFFASHTTGRSVAASEGPATTRDSDVVDENKSHLHGLHGDDDDDDDDEPTRGRTSSASNNNNNSNNRGHQGGAARGGASASPQHEGSQQQSSSSPDPREASVSGDGGSSTNNNREASSPTQQQQHKAQSSSSSSPSQSASPTAGTAAAAATVASGRQQAGAKKKKVFHGDNLEYKYPSGSHYIGSFRDGKLNGYGKYTYHPSGDIYEGEWLNDMKHGKGVYTYEGGDVYTGEWRHGKKHGKGNYLFKSGDEYVGNWHEDRIHGYGVFVIAKNNNRYEGQWFESYRHGPGILRSGNGNVYDGQWYRGKEHGLGVLTYPDGRLFAGTWKQGQMDGKGVLLENGTKHLVEYVGGFLTSKDPIPEDAVVDPAFNAANKLYVAARRRQHQHHHHGDGRGGNGAAGGGHAGTASEQLQKVTVERDMWHSKYQDLLKSKGVPPFGDEDESTDPESITSATELRRLLIDARSQRNAQRRRADEALAREKLLDETVAELNFNLDTAQKALAHHEASSSSSAGGSGDGASSEETLQRRVFELESELRRMQSSVAGGSSSSSVGGGAGGGASSPTAASGASGGGASSAEVIELRAKLELLEGDSARLRQVKENLKKKEDEASQLRTNIRDLEYDKSTLERQLRVYEQRSEHDSMEAHADLLRKTEAQHSEIRELQKDLREAMAETEQAKEKTKATIDKLRVAETKSLQVSDLQAQLDLLRQNRSKEAAVADRKVEELDKEKQKTAALQKQVDELQQKVRSSQQQQVQASSMMSLPDSPLARGASGSNQNAEAIAELEAKIEHIEKEKADREKKEKKKLKKLLLERDDALGKMAEAQRGLSAATLQLRSLIDSKVLTFCRITDEQEGKSTSSEAEQQSGAVVVKAGPNHQSVIVANENFSVDDVLTSPSPTAPGTDSSSSSLMDSTATNLKSMCHGVVLGFNCSVISFGGMRSGKSTSVKSLLPLLLRDTLEPCSAKTATHEVNVTLQCIELSCDGISDLFSPAAASGDGPVIIKDCYNSVVFENCASHPVANVAAFRDIASTFLSTAESNRKRSRSHVLYVMNCVMRHRVTDVATFGKLLVADLAGMGSLGEQDDVDSAAYVNSSIMKLHQVVDALTTVGQTAVPYREDPLTMALSDAFGGNSRTAVLVHAPTGAASLDYTQQAVNTAVKARGIVNAPIKRSETNDVIQLRRTLMAIDSSAVPATTSEIGTIRE